MNQSKKIQKFKTGDVIWVPNMMESSNGNRVMWPAKFFKETNRQDICLVHLYGVKNYPNQFVVDTEEIVDFDKFDASNIKGDILKAYQLALYDYVGQSNESPPQKQISTASQFCDFIQSQVILSNCRKNKESTQKLKPIPRFTTKDLPLKNQDLNLYINRMIPQMLSFLIKMQGQKSKYGLFLQQTKTKIVKTVIMKLDKNQIHLAQ